MAQPLPGAVWRVLRAGEEVVSEGAVNITTLRDLHTDACFKVGTFFLHRMRAAVLYVDSWHVYCRAIC